MAIQVLPFYNIAHSIRTTLYLRFFCLLTASKSGLHTCRILLSSSFFRYPRIWSRTMVGSFASCKWFWLLVNMVTLVDKCCSAQWELEWGDLPWVHRDLAMIAVIAPILLLVLPQQCSVYRFVRENKKSKHFMVQPLVQKVLILSIFWAPKMWDGDSPVNQSLLPSHAGRIKMEPKSFYGSSSGRYKNRNPAVFPQDNKCEQFDQYNNLIDVALMQKTRLSRYPLIVEFRGLVLDKLGEREVIYNVNFSRPECLVEGLTRVYVTGCEDLPSDQRRSIMTKIVKHTSALAKIIVIIPQDHPGFKVYSIKGKTFLSNLYYQLTPWYAWERNCIFIGEKLKHWSFLAP